MLSLCAKYSISFWKHPPFQCPGDPMRLADLCRRCLQKRWQKPWLVSNWNLCGQPDGPNMAAAHVLHLLPLLFIRKKRYKLSQNKKCYFLKEEIVKSATSIGFWEFWIRFILRGQLWFLKSSCALQGWENFWSWETKLGQILEIQKPCKTSGWWK